MELRTQQRENSIDQNGFMRLGKTDEIDVGS